MIEELRYWKVHVIAQSGRPGDTNPIAVFKVITRDGEEPNDEDMLGACAWAGIKEGRVFVFPQVEIERFERPSEISFKGSTSETWIINSICPG